MFIRDFLYTIKIMVRGRVSIFWTLVFPLLLATFMYMAFGNIYEQDEMFRNIKVAVSLRMNRQMDLIICWMRCRMAMTPFCRLRG